MLYTVSYRSTVRFWSVKFKRKARSESLVQQQHGGLADETK